MKPLGANGRPRFLPFFTVVIPTYNRAPLLQVALHSVLQQSFDDFEVIVVDNGSTDDTKAYVSSEVDPRIRYIFQAGSGSPASPRNHGIRQARGEWIAFLDSDDSWNCSKLETLHSALSAESFDFVTHWQHLLHKEGRVIGSMEPRQEYLSYENLLLTENPIATSSVAVRRQFLETHNLRFSESKRFAAVEDYDLWLRILAAGARPIVINQFLGSNREVDGHMGVPSLFFENLHHLYREHAWAVQTFTSEKDELEKRLSAGIALRMSMIHVREKKWILAGKQLMRAAWLCPSEFIRYVRLRLHQRHNALSRRSSKTG